ncbi:hypothetical protein KFK09_017268 [Dendrobium nobile]|uniref:NB-ARC domain-containing protein n=1 Tax=Dendrobium nobile TaxID=94219 RepID=A0A8T3B1S5_DENNO|nr:hypothetical protein KFK09_017268 [Dendrobium nobile]
MFDHVIFAEASKDYKLEQIQRDISSWLRLIWRKRGQAKEIRDFLENKIFLLLLDNLWKHVELSYLGIPHLTQNRTTKQKVVFTTRLEGVCGKMQAWRMMKVGCLNADATWLLFQEKVGKDALEAHATIPQLAQRVAKECDGLPLALVVIGAAMSTKKTTSEWQNALTLLQKSRLYEIQGMGDKILPQLKFSYNHLPNEIFRRCFLLCSLWPSISKTELIEC